MVLPAAGIDGRVSGVRFSYGFKSELEFFSCVCKTQIHTDISK